MEKTDCKEFGENTECSCKKDDLLSSAIWISVLSFLPVALYSILMSLKEAVRYNLILHGFTLANDYRMVTDLLENAGTALCVMLLLLLFAWWITRYIGAVRKTDNIYKLYTLYRQWRVGLFFLCNNAIVLSFHTFTLIKTPWFIEYIGSTLIAIFIVMVCNIVFKKKTGDLMIASKNLMLDKINSIYFIISGICIAILIVTLIYYAIVGGSVVPLAVFFTLIVFFAVAFAIGLSYAVLRVLLHFNKNIEENKKTE